MSGSGLDVDPLGGQGIPARVAAGEQVAVRVPELADRHARERLSVRRELELVPELQRAEVRPAHRVVPEEHGRAAVRAMTHALPRAVCRAPNRRTAIGDLDHAVPLGVRLQRLQGRQRRPAVHVHHPRPDELGACRVVGPVVAGRRRDRADGDHDRQDEHCDRADQWPLRGHAQSPFRLEVPAAAFIADRPARSPARPARGRRRPARTPRVRAPPTPPRTWP